MKIIHNQTDVNGFWSAGSGRAAAAGSGASSDIVSQQCKNMPASCKHYEHNAVYAMHEFMWNFHRIIILCSLTIDNC